MLQGSARLAGMTRLAAIALCFAALGCTQTEPLRGYSERQPHSAEEQRAYVWFRALGYPDLSEAPFVRFYTGSWEQRGGDPPHPVPDHGFLLQDRDGVFSVFTLGLETVTLRQGASKLPYERVGYERISFEDYVRSGLHELEHRSTDRPSRREPFGHLEYSPPLLFRLVTVSNACASRGQMALAHRVWLELRRAIRRGNDEAPVLELMKHEVSEEAYSNLIIGFGDPHRAISDQLAGFRWWRDKFGEDERVTEAIDILEKMVAEKAPADTDSVAGLIHQLRHTKGTGTNAARKLADRGFEAVPELIAALGDRRFTRSVGRPWNGKGYLREPVTVGRVGDLARGILLQISTVQRFQARDGDALRKEVQQWWDEARTKNERDYLVGRVEAAEKYVILPARRLLQLYPDAAEDAILSGLRVATDEDARYGLVLTLETIKSARATTALLGEVKAAEPRRRLLVSWLLLARGHNEGVQAVIELWRGSGSARDEAAHFLCHCGRLEALKALGEDLAERPTRDRFQVVRSLRQDWSPRFVAKEQITLQAGWLDAVEALLASNLLDTGTMTGMSIGTGEDSFRDPRICDVAASALARHFPGKYTFDRTGTQASRDRQCRLLANIWRREHGLEPLDVPPPHEGGAPKGG